MVFIALPALQRNQRDTQRRQDMSRFKDALERYKSNNRGKLPWSYDMPRLGGVTETQTFFKKYLGSDRGEFVDPSGGYSEYSSYAININYRTGDTPNAVSPNFSKIITIHIGFRCQGEDAVRATDGNYTIRYYLESGSVYCIDG